MLLRRSGTQCQDADVGWERGRGYGSHETGVRVEEVAVKVKQFDLCPSTGGRGWAEVVDLRLY